MDAIDPIYRIWVLRIDENLESIIYCKSELVILYQHEFSSYVLIIINFLPYTSYRWTSYMSYRNMYILYMSFKLVIINSEFYYYSLFVLYYFVSA